MEIILTVNIVLAAVLLLGGCMLRFVAKPDTEDGVGYKTAAASGSGEARGFANRFCGRLWIAVGVGALAAELCVLCFLEDQLSVMTSLKVQAVILVLQIVAAVAAVISTEQALKKRFGGKS
jgi:uncharacterized membrane protein